MELAAARRRLVGRRQGPRGPGRARARGGAARRRLPAARPRRRPAARCRRRRPRRRRPSRAAVRAGAYSTTLLKGVTGSGKTEVYLEAVAEALRLGRQALVLLPEIALSAQFLDRVEARFGARPAEWHSGVTQAARRRAWTAVAAGDARLVVGARSALFLPFARPRAHRRRRGARRLLQAGGRRALPRPRHGGAARLDRGRGGRPRLRHARASNPGPTPTPASTPGSTCPSASASPSSPRCGAIDLRAHPPEPGRWISDPLARAVTERLAAGEQALLFLNRRGYAPLDHLPRLRPPGRLRPVRRPHGRAPLPQAPGLPPVRRDEADPRPPAPPARPRAG